MFSRILLPCAAVMLASGAVGASAHVRPPVIAPAADSQVAIRTFGFRPDTLRVVAGSRVEWVNQDDIEHTVTSGAPGGRDGRFAGTLPRKDAKFGASFEKPGVYSYFCDRHQFMRGEVHVIPQESQQ
ncbi:MAG: plastocyanin/azurin family copper-binding protein [Gemmatimonadaceae bacterium]